MNATQSIYLILSNKNAQDSTLHGHCTHSWNDIRNYSQFIKQQQFGWHCCTPNLNVPRLFYWFLNFPTHHAHTFVYTSHIPSTNFHPSYSYTRTPSSVVDSNQYKHNKICSFDVVRVWVFVTDSHGRNWDVGLGKGGLVRPLWMNCVTVNWVGKVNPIHVHLFEISNWFLRNRSFLEPWI